MPPLSTRIYPKSTEYERIQDEPHSLGGGPDQGVSQLHPYGNIAPIRSLAPIEFTYDFQVQRFNPDTPFFQRGNVDTVVPIRNLALQAASAAGIKIT